MSSVVIWEDRATAVTVSWNKQGPHTVFVPLRIDADGICDGRTSEWPSEEEAIQAGKEAARLRLEEMRNEDPRKRLFRILLEREPAGVSSRETHGRDWFISQRFDAPVLDELDAIPVAGTCRLTSSDGYAVLVQRVE